MGQEHPDIVMEFGNSYCTIVAESPPLSPICKLRNCAILVEMVSISANLHITPVFAAVVFLIGIAIFGQKETQIWAN